jgi:predicted nucleic acid-binding protein
MVYLDTSVLVSLFVREVHSAPVRAWFGGQVPDTLCSSLWTRTELAAALGAKVRSGLLAAQNARAVLAVYDNLTRRSVTILVPMPADFALATRLVENFESSLRAPDALHLAIAQNNGVTDLATGDKVLAEAAAAVGLNPVVPTQDQGLI